MWFDAPIGYLAATREWADAGHGRRSDRRLGSIAGGGPTSAPTTSRYTEFMGKDNVPFHTLTFPATILGSGEPWKLVDRLKSFNWLTYYGGKFSTSERRGVFMSDALELLPADYWRWYLMANAPESDDASFTWDLFGEAVNKDLVGTFGNFVNRTATQVARHFDEVVPDGRRAGRRGGRARPSGSTPAWPSTSRAMDDLEFRKATAALRALWAEGNVYLEDREPWKTIKVDREPAPPAPFGPHCGSRCCTPACRHRSSRPPPTGCWRHSRMSMPDRTPSARTWWPPRRLRSPRATASSRPDLLFAKIPPEDLVAFADRFGGSESATVPTAPEEVGS